MTYIYAYTKDNKAYVGKTVDIRQRKYKHSSRFKGWDFQIIDSIDSFDKSQWKPLESCWITAYSEGGYEMENKNKGGNGMSGWQTEEGHKIINRKGALRHYHNNREKKKEYNKQHHLDNKEYQKQYYSANKEKLIEYQRQYQKQYYQLKKQQNAL